MGSNTPTITRDNSVITILFFCLLEIIISGLHYLNPVYYTLLAREDGPVDTLNAIVLFVVSVLLLVSRPSGNRLGRLLMLFNSLLFFVIMMEEISWGQRIFNLSTPEWFVDHNRQNELSFHNIDAGGYDMSRLLPQLLSQIVLFFLIGTSVALVLNYQSIFNIKLPELSQILCFWVYAQHFPIYEFHVVYLLVILLLLGLLLIRKYWGFITPIVLASATTFIVPIIYGNELNELTIIAFYEYHEFLFSVCSLFYAVQIYRARQNQNSILVS